MGLHFKKIVKSFEVMVNFHDFLQVSFKRTISLILLSPMEYRSELKIFRGSRVIKTLPPSSFSKKFDDLIFSVSFDFTSLAEVVDDSRVSQKPIEMFDYS